MVDNFGRLAAEKLDQYIDPLDAPQRTIKLLERVIVGEGWAQGVNAKTLAAESHSTFERFLLKRISAAAESRRLLSFEFSSETTTVVQGSCFIFESDGQEIAEYKRQRSNALPMLQTVQDLSPREFEFLCGVILAKLGVEEPFISPSSNDQGVDFFGKAAFGDLVKKTVLPDAVEENLKIWIVGQAKRKNDTKVGTSDLRELVGSVELARSKIYSSDSEVLEGLSLRLCDPVFSIIVCSGRFTKGSETLLGKAGIIGLDGIQLCQFLSDHGVGNGDDGFERELLLSEIRSMEQRVQFIKSE
ncbi:restriction endonuclease [Aurantiacibacter odishensis]|uniref:restriction endonuclease n=1 Tax=Aurantiacibacter odishensis TaxID=1155476 RepID=UPI000E762FC3|nr:restriction endonuclease [Aurantiacibacter odishensis]